MSLAAGMLRLAPFSVPFGRTFSGASVEVTVTAAASVVHGLVYATGADGWPTGAPLIDASIDTHTATGVIQVAGPWTLPPGLYAMGTLALGGGPTVRAKSIGVGSWVGQETGGNANVTGWALGALAAVPTSPAVTADQSGLHPKVMLIAA
jgi:hypothetical protein